MTSSASLEVVLLVGPAKLGGVGTVAGAAHSPSRGGCPGTFVGQRCFACTSHACRDRCILCSEHACALPCVPMWNS